MADSVGGPVFPRSGIQEGHLHFDKTSNTLHVYNGGDAADTNNWSEVTIGGGGGGGGDSFQRYHWRLTGLENQNVITEFFLFSPFVGTITEWALFGNGALVPAPGAEIQLVIDPFGAFTIVDTVMLPTNFGGLSGTIVRPLNQPVVDGDVLYIINNTIFSPAITNNVLSGYVDLTPS